MLVDRSAEKIQTLEHPVGILELSFDFELGWGAIESGLWKAREATGVYERLRKVLAVLLNEMRAMEIPAIWATVGAMIDEPGNRDFDHLPRMIRNTIQSALEIGHSKTFDGRDLFELVKKSSSKHYIAGHSYSHTRFSCPGVSSSVVTGDLARAAYAFGAYSEEPKFFVFPQNHEEYYKEVGKSGYLIVRGAPENNCRNEPQGLFDRWRNRVAISPPMSMEDAIENLKRITGSMFFNARGGRLYALPLPYIRSKRGLNQSVLERKVFHVWVHPFNLAESPTLFMLFLRFLRFACEARDASKLAIGIPSIETL